jgi:mannose-6-phosphate isomerase
MPFSEPLSFKPIYQERIWGGRTLERTLARQLPDAERIGESWEIVDRPEAQSVVLTGVHRDLDLHSLWRDHREAVFGKGFSESERFPLLIKILDARESLSVQVHPSGKEEQGQTLGEPKNEWWYIIDADPGAAIYAGFTHHLSQADFEAAIAEGAVEKLLHRIPVKAGDSIYIPGGRCHAIGAGCLIAEVQQNSDTTFRVFDWNRTGPDGHPRALHIAESLACLDLRDATPSLAPALAGAPFACEFFKIEKIDLQKPSIPPDAGGAVFLVLSGKVSVGSHTFSIGQWFLLPHEAAALVFSPDSGATALLQVRLP